VYEVDEHQGQPYFALEYVAGDSLDRHPARPSARWPSWPGPWQRSTLRAMAAVHAAGISHRNLKPANLLRQGPAARVPVCRPRPPPWSGGTPTRRRSSVPGTFPRSSPRPSSPGPTPWQAGGNCFGHCPGAGPWVVSAKANINLDFPGERVA
jgi:hypothetical protein